MFETTGVLNEEIFRELSKYIVSHKKKKFFLTYATIFALLGLLYLVLGLINSNSKFILFGVCFIAFAIIAIGIILYAKKRFIQSNMDILGEVTDTKDLKVNVFFNENCVVVNHLNNSSKTEIKYEFFNRMLETSNTYFLLTNANQYAVVFKDCLNTEESNTFKEFIKTKCKNIK